MMAIQGHGMTNYFLEEDLKGNIDWDKNTFKLALFTNDEDLNPDTTETYTTSANEVTGGSIPQGGILLDPNIVEDEQGPYIEISDIEATNIPVGTVVRGGILYQETPNIAVAIVNFEQDHEISNGTFFIRMSRQELGHPIIRLVNSRG